MGSQYNILQPVYETAYYQEQWIKQLCKVNLLGTANEVIRVGRTYDTDVDRVGNEILHRQYQGIAQAVKKAVEFWKARIGLEGEEFLVQSVKRYVELEGLVFCSVGQYVAGYDGAGEFAAFRSACEAEEASKTEGQPHASYMRYMVTPY
jgi:hypothetical protein